MHVVFNAGSVLTGVQHQSKDRKNMYGKSIYIMEMPIGQIRPADVMCSVFAILKK